MGKHNEFLQELQEVSNKHNALNLKLVMKSPCIQKGKKMGETPGELKKVVWERVECPWNKYHWDYYYGIV